MKKETKFDVGDIVYYCESGKVKTGKIVACEINYRYSTDPKISNKDEVRYAMLDLNTHSSNIVYNNENGLYQTEKDAVDRIVTQITEEISECDRNVLIALKEKLEERVNEAI